MVYGHVLQTNPLPTFAESVDGVRCVGIDTGCCFGGRLTAVVFPNLDVLQIAAKATYDAIDQSEPD